MLRSEVPSRLDLVAVHISMLAIRYTEARALADTNGGIAFHLWLRLSFAELILHPKKAGEAYGLLLTRPRGVRIRGAEGKSLVVSEGRHELQLESGNSIFLEVSESKPSLVIVGASVNGDGSETRNFTIRECLDETELPRSALPLHGPTGEDQTFPQARLKAVVGLALALVIKFGTLDTWRFGISYRIN